MMPENILPQTLYSQTLPKPCSYLTHAVPTWMLCPSAFIQKNPIHPSKFKSTIIVSLWPFLPPVSLDRNQCLSSRAHWAILIKPPIVEPDSTQARKPLFVLAHTFFCDSPQRHYLYAILLHLQHTSMCLALWGNTRNVWKLNLQFQMKIVLRARDNYPTAELNMNLILLPKISMSCQ